MFGHNSRGCVKQGVSRRTKDWIDVQENVASVDNDVQENVVATEVKQENVVDNDVLVQNAGNIVANEVVVVINVVANEINYVINVVANEAVSVIF